jgi:hypothetical protein
VFCLLLCLITGHVHAVSLDVQVGIAASGVARILIQWGPINFF